MQSDPGPLRFHFAVDASVRNSIRRIRMIEIRKENPDDYDDVRAINDLAFGQSIEGEIVKSIGMHVMKS